jgi:hypothetical protein
VIELLSIVPWIMPELRRARSQEIGFSNASAGATKQQQGPPNKAPKCRIWVKPEMP